MRRGTKGYCVTSPTFSATSPSYGWLPERMPPLRLSAGARGDNAETRELCVYASLPPLGPSQKPTRASSKYTQKEMDRFDQDYIEKETLNSTTSFVRLGRESQPSKPGMFVVETAHDAIRLQAVLAYKRPK